MIMLVCFIVVFIWSGIDPKSRVTWFLETSPALLGIGILCWTYRRFSFTTLFYIVAFLSGLIMLVGGHYSYSNVPLFNELKSFLGSQRNDFDRFGHLFQGIVSALFFREVFIRKQIVNHYLPMVVIGLSLAVSACYELIEFLSVFFKQGDIKNFLGTQGDPWDTQWDMICALSGSILSLLFFHKLHDRQIAHKKQKSH